MIPTQSLPRPAFGWIFLAVLAAAAPLAHADENFFGYSYGAETLPKGHGEAYQWITHRAGKADGTYQATDFVTEYEYGLTDRLQGAVELTAAHYNVHGVSDFDDARRTVFTGGSFELKYALRSPYKDGYGLAAYVEAEYSTIDAVPGDRIREYALETKLIYQKNYLDDSLIYIANLSFEPELAKEHGETAHELGLEFSHGIAYRVAPRWYVGLENRWDAKFEPIRLNQWSHYAGFIGPTIHYGTKRWWATLSWLPQVTGWPATRHGLTLDDHERNEYRLKVGIEF